MRRRLICCIAGGLLGISVAPTINASLELAPALAAALCSLGGMLIGYVASTLIDVFTAKPDSLLVDTRQSE